MAGRRRKAPRKAKRGHPAPALGPAQKKIAGRPPAAATTPSKGPSAVAFKRRGGRFTGTSDAEFGKFLSPEQQHLLRKRREAEQREAKRRRSVAGILLAVVAVVGGGVWALLRL